MLVKITWSLSLTLILILALAACNTPATIEEPIPAIDVVEPVQETEVTILDIPATAVYESTVSTPLPEIEEGEIVVETAVLPISTSSTLTDTEIEALQFMREEEKLARDVYLSLYEQWGLPIFQNIAGSEQTHMDTVLSLMQRYEIADSAANHGPGQFANTDLQALYDQLIASGSQSLGDALRVGALIEETDIADLESRLATIQNTEIIQAFNNLSQGSFNHLRSYAGMLERQTGEVYQPQVLTAAAYADILAGSQNGMGSQNQGGTQGQGNGRGNGNGNGNGQGSGNGNS